MTEGKIGPLGKSWCPEWGVDGSGEDEDLVEEGKEEDEEAEAEDSCSLGAGLDSDSVGGWRLDMSSPSSASIAMSVPTDTFFAPSPTCKAASLYAFLLNIQDMRVLPQSFPVYHHPAPLHP